MQSHVLRRNLLSWLSLIFLCSTGQRPQSLSIVARHSLPPNTVFKWPRRLPVDKYPLADTQVCKSKAMSISMVQRLPTEQQPYLLVYFHITFSNVCLSCSVPNIVSIGLLASRQISSLFNPKCWAMREYSLERLLPNTPTSSVCSH
jgi:hypothetical protein